MYGDPKPLHQLLADQAIANSADIENDHGELIARLNACLDAQFELLRFTIWTLKDGEFGARGETEPILFLALHKNAFVFFSSIDLAKRGFYGPACTLLRPIFEALAIAKYCSITSESNVFKRWRAGKYVHLLKHVLDHITHPLTEMRTLWNGLNSLVHATKHAQQVEHQYAKTKKEVRATLGIIQVLLYWNHHLLTRHFLTRASIYYTRSYGDRLAFDNARARERALAKRMRKYIAGEGTRLVHEYCSKWVAKPSTRSHLTTGQNRLVQKQKLVAPGLKSNVDMA